MNRGQLKAYRSLFAIALVVSLTAIVILPGPAKATVPWEVKGHAEVGRLPVTILGFGPDGSAYVLIDDNQARTHFLRSISPTGSTLWVHDYLRVFDSLVGPDGILYLSALEPSSNDLAYQALTAQGQVMWSIPNITVGHQYAVDGTVYVAILSGGEDPYGLNQWNLTAIGREGEIKWTLSLDSYISPSVTGGDDGRLTVITESSTYTVNADDGTVLEQVPSAYRYVPYGAKVWEGTSYRLVNDYPPNDSWNSGGLQAVDSNGTYLWKYPQGSALENYDEFVINDDGLIFLISSNNTYAGFGQTLTAIESDGKAVWSYKDDHIIIPKKIGDDLIIWNRSGIASLDLTGKVSWKLEAIAYGSSQRYDQVAVAADEGHIAVVDDGTLYMLGEVRPATDTVRPYVALVAAVSALGLLFTLWAGKRIR